MSIDSNGNGNQSSAVCPGCGGSDIGIAQVRSAFFHEDRLVVVEDIPALVCASCNEQFYDDQTVVVLDLLRGDGFPAESARVEIRVPVFSFHDRLTTEAET
jgi:YgiT-type zinc finger domain-containing protein